MYSTNPFIKWWFWLLMLSIVGFIIAFIMFETTAPDANGDLNPNVWTWVIFAVAAVFLIVAFILYAVDLAAYKRWYEIAEACGELPPPKIKAKIVCPPKCPPPPCPQPCPPPPCPKPCPPPEPAPCPQPPCPQAEVIPTIAVAGPVVPVQSAIIVSTPTVQTITVSADDAFAAAGIKPLASLAY